MTVRTSQDDTMALGDYVAVIRRRARIVAAVTLLGLAGALAIAFLQPSKYKASAEVLLSKQNLAAALTDTFDPSQNLQPDRFAETQADLASIPAVAARALAAAGVVDRTAQDLIDASTVRTKGGTDLIQFAVVDRDPRIARRLATAYAQQFAVYRRELDTAAIARAMSGLQERIVALEKSGDRRSGLYASLVGKQEQLRTLGALQTGNVVVVRTAGEAWKVQPRPLMMAVLGLGLGLVAGIIAVFVLDSLDTRIRTAEDVVARLGLPMLARLAEPSKRLQASDQVVMVAEPNTPDAEAYRMLRVNLDFANHERDARAIMITSAVEREGKSTIVANLGIALARTGRRVVVVDLDLRRPRLSRIFRAGTVGLTGIALHDLSIDAALMTVAIGDNELVPVRRHGSVQMTAIAAGPPRIRAWLDHDAPAARAAANGNGNGNGSGKLKARHKRNGNGNGNGNGYGHGGLHAHEAQVASPAAGQTTIDVLPSGALPPNAEFVGHRALGRILDDLRERYDVVLIDAPPLLRVSDAMALSDRVDAILPVVRLGLVKRHALDELRRLLQACPAEKLGFVLSGDESETSDEYYSYFSPTEDEAPARRPAGVSS